MRTVLVVEDEPTVRELLCRALEWSGYAVLVGGSARDALGLAAAHEVQEDAGVRRGEVRREQPPHGLVAAEAVDEHHRRAVSLDVDVVAREDGHGTFQAGCGTRMRPRKDCR